MTLDEAKAAVEAAGLTVAASGRNSLHITGGSRAAWWYGDRCGLYIPDRATIHEAIAAAKGEIARAPDAFDSRLIDATSELVAAVRDWLADDERDIGELNSRAALSLSCLMKTLEAAESLLKVK